MKAIIIAAGQGRRLKHLTDTTPKCLLEINGKSILQYQLEAFAANEIQDISLIRGYQQEKINLPDLKYYFNDNYQKNNILNSLMYAQEQMNGEFIASYSDIVFQKEVVKKLAGSTADIAIVVDLEWESAYQDRNTHPVEEAEKVIFDEKKSVVEIGKIISKDNDIGGEFIGIIKCSASGARKFLSYFQEAKKKFENKPFIRASSFEKAYLTDFIQYLVDEGQQVQCVLIKGGWLEIDTVEDFNRAKKVLKKEF